MCFGRTGWPFPEGWGAVPWGRVLRVRRLVVASHTSPDFPWSPALCVQCQTARQNTGSPGGPGQRPILGQCWLGMVDGSPGSSRKLLRSLPRQEIENSPAFFSCLQGAGLLLASSSSCGTSGWTWCTPGPSLSALVRQGQ